MGYRRFHRIPRFACGLLTGIVTSAAVMSQEVPGYPANVEAFDHREVSMLPGYCIYTQMFRERVPGGGNPAEIARWAKVLGEPFHHLHHYCLGLMKTNRGVLLARDLQVRNFYLTGAVSEFDYVIERAPADFVLLPEILTKKGENLIRLGRGPVGVTQLERAIELKPDYWPAYAQISDFYAAAGDTKKARAVLARGLNFAADSAALRRRLKEIDQELAKAPGTDSNKAAR